MGFLLAQRYDRMRRESGGRNEKGYRVPVLFDYEGNIVLAPDIEGSDALARMRDAMVIGWKAKLREGVAPLAVS